MLVQTYLIKNLHPHAIDIFVKRPAAINAGLLPKVRNSVNIKPNQVMQVEVTRVDRATILELFKKKIIDLQVVWVEALPPNPSEPTNPPEPSNPTEPPIPDLMLIGAETAFGDTILGALTLDNPVFEELSSLDIRHIAPQTADSQQLLASLNTGGLARSTDKGRTWALYGVSAGAVFNEIFVMPQAVGLVPAGRIFALPNDGDLDYMWFSDDDGATWGWTYPMSMKPAADRGSKILQTIGVAKRMLAMRINLGGSCRIDRSDDGGDNWDSQIALAGLFSYGCGLEQDLTGRLHAVAFNLANVVQYIYSDDEGITWSANAGAGMYAFPYTTSTLRTGFHAANGDVLAVCREPDASLIGLSVVNRQDGFHKVYLPTGIGVIPEIITGIDYVMGINGRPEEWVISCRSAANSYWVHVKFTLTADPNPVLYDIWRVTPYAGASGLLGNIISFG